MPYALYSTATREILSVSKNRIPNDALPEGYACTPFDGTAKDAREKRVDDDGYISDRPDAAITDEQLSEAWDRLRQRRWTLLSRSDWTQIADVPARTRRAWAGYRQQLRDLPQNTRDPRNPTWPEAPE